ncbi:MAG TPA: hypothetical protein VJT80_20855 [Steroidobacteraceae bacterium]|nr:hypothetical protein [Steroidobacteraceae bacterium]
MKSADDAFGTSVGNESIGLYQPFEVRGFSAVDAGNVRLDGLYFDRQADPITLLVPSSTMRLSFGNVFDKFGWRTNASEVFVTNAPRRLAITFAADFPGN